MQNCINNFHGNIEKGDGSHKEHVKNAEKGEKNYTVSMKESSSGNRVHEASCIAQLTAVVVAFLHHTSMKLVKSTYI